MPLKKRHADRVAASKSTVDELLANGRALNRAKTNFLKVDVDTALTFASLALQAEDSIKKQRNQRSARKAYDTVLRFTEKVTLSDDDAQKLSRKLSRLKSELQTLGEVF